MSRLTRDGTAEPVSRDQILRHERGQGNIHFSCSADHVQDWQPYPVDPYSCYMCVHTYCCIHRSRAMRILLIYSTKVSTCTAESYNYIVTGCRCNGIIYVLYGIYVLLYS